MRDVKQLNPYRPAPGQNESDINYEGCKAVSLRFSVSWQLCQILTMRDVKCKNARNKSSQQRSDINYEGCKDVTDFSGVIQKIVRY